MSNVSAALRNGVSLPGMVSPCSEVVFLLGVGVWPASGVGGLVTVDELEDTIIRVCVVATAS